MENFRGNRLRGWAIFFSWMCSITPILQVQTLKISRYTVIPMYMYMEEQTKFLGGKPFLGWVQLSRCHKIVHVPVHDIHVHIHSISWNFRCKHVFVVDPCYEIKHTKFKACAILTLTNMHGKGSLPTKIIQHENIFLTRKYREWWVHHIQSTFNKECTCMYTTS